MNTFIEQAIGKAEEHMRAVPSLMTAAGQKVAHWWNGYTIVKGNQLAVLHPAILGRIACFSDKRFLLVSKKFSKCRGAVLQGRGDLVGKVLVYYFQKDMPLPLYFDLQKIQHTISSLNLSFGSRSRDQFPLRAETQRVAQTFRQVHTIKASGSRIDTNFVNDIANAFPQITSLAVIGSQEILNGVIPVVARGFANLTQLDISGCSKLTDQALIHISTLMPALQSLVSAKCPLMTINGIRALAANTALTQLTMSHVYKIQEAFAFLKGQIPHLETAEMQEGRLLELYYASSDRMMQLQERLAPHSKVLVFTVLSLAFFVAVLLDDNEKAKQAAADLAQPLHDAVTRECKKLFYAISTVQKDCEWRQWRQWQSFSSVAKIEYALPPLLSATRDMIGKTMTACLNSISQSHYPKEFGRLCESYAHPATQSEIVSQRSILSEKIQKYREDKKKYYMTYLDTFRGANEVVLNVYFKTLHDNPLFAKNVQEAVERDCVKEMHHNRYSKDVQNLCLLPQDQIKASAQELNAKAIWPTL
ncbi:MAG: hypothetical protein JWO53_1074 [Chlamydiia bacterium]|nr:hypothetical protein [Chlamydiia bacterium]